MNRSLIFSCIILFIIPIFSLAQVVIDGKIHNYNGKSEIYFSHTWDGIHTINFKTIKPKANGAFKIKLDNTGYGTVNLSYNLLNYRFFINDDSHLSIEIDQDKIHYPKRFSGRTSDGTDRGYILDSIKQEATMSIQGDYKNINDFYNSSLKISYGSLSKVNGNGYSRSVAQLATPGQVLSFIDSLAQREIDAIVLLSIQFEPEVSSVLNPEQEIRDFLINEVRAFYATVFLNAMFLKRKEQVIKISEDSLAPLRVYNRQWEELVKSFIDNLPDNITPLPNSSDYNELVRVAFYTLKSYKEYQYPDSYIDDDIFEKLLIPDPLLFNDPKTVMAFRMDALNLFLNSEIYYTPALLDAVYQMQDKYPNQAHWELLNPLIRKVEISLAAASKNFKEAKLLKMQYTSFMDLIEQFKGKNLFIDIWATWCGPCIKDFQYKEVTQPFVDDHQLERLYISIDNPQWKQRWKQSIKYHKLQGYHIRANNELIKDMWHVLGGQEGAIPRYVLIDREGNIFLSSAARPSQSEKLLGQIKMLLQD